MSIKLAFCLEDPVREDTQIRKFMVEYLGDETKAEVWVRRVCGGRYAFCARDHLTVVSETAYVKWLAAKEVKRSEVKINEGEEEEPK